MKRFTILILLLALSSVAFACGQQPPVSASGIYKAETKVQSGADGLTIEQRNIVDRLALDNKIGSIKHLYIISAYSGQCILYSTVRGKVTSSGKRLDPSTVDGGEGSRGFLIRFGAEGFYTNEVLGADGTYGPSIEYLYWWDSKGVYHQQYVTGGMMVHVSDQPITVKSVIINIESR